jgi:hypothetical protein
MNADAELDAPVLRNACVPLDHRVLDFEGAPEGVDHAAEFDDRAVAGALDDPAVAHRNGWIDEVAAPRLTSPNISPAHSDFLLGGANLSRALIGRRKSGEISS